MRGETVAADHLASIGYRIIERNWRCPVGELDLIAEDGGTLVFVEVRSRRDTGSFGTPEESVDARKQKRLRELARMYLYRGRAFDRKTRFDVVAVTFAPDGELLGLRHVKSAF
jgi:putative endonuclease